MVGGIGLSSAECGSYQLRVTPVSIRIVLLHVQTAQTVLITLLNYVGFATWEIADKCLRCCVLPPHVTRETL